MQCKIFVRNMETNIIWEGALYICGSIIWGTLVFKNWQSCVRSTSM